MTVDRAIGDDRGLRVGPLHQLGPRVHPSGIGDQGLEEAELEIAARHGEDGILGPERRPFGQRLDVDVVALKERERLLEPREDRPRPVLGERGGADLRGDLGVLALALERGLPSQEVDVGHLARADLLGRGHEQARRTLGARHRVRP